ncbi:MAG TPA: hypothetical protein PK908_01095 [Bacteroidales bacterium]|nr:hypothetical protein [Bacteroidales bacterium]
MRYFLKSLLLFSIPFFLWVLAVLLIDPFNFYGQKDAGFKDKVQFEIGNQINTRLYKLIQFSKQPNRIVVIGDSRAHALKKEEIKKITGLEITNMSFGGSHFGEMRETFWHLVTKYQIDEVYWGLSFFNLSKDGLSGERIQEAERLMANPITYSFNIHSYRAIIAYAKYLLTGEVIQLGKFKETKEEVWKRQLNFAQEVYGRYVYYADFASDLSKIVTYCTSNNIKIHFFVPPTHVDLQNRIYKADLGNEYEDFKHVMMKYPSFNFDIPNTLTENMDNFKDPFHFTEEVSRGVIEKLFNFETNN